MPGIYLLWALIPLDEIVLSGTCKKVVCSSLPYSVAVDGHYSQKNMHQRVLLLGFMEGTLKWFVDDALSIYLSVQYMYVKMMTNRNRFVYGTYKKSFFITHPTRSVRWASSKR